MSLIEIHIDLYVKLISFDWFIRHILRHNRHHQHSRIIIKPKCIQIIPSFEIITTQCYTIEFSFIGKRTDIGSISPVLSSHQNSKLSNICYASNDVVGNFHSYRFIHLTISNHRLFVIETETIDFLSIIHTCL